MLKGHKFPLILMVASGRFLPISTSTCRSMVVIVRLQKLGAVQAFAKRLWAAYW